jgi:hypothetical protein
MRRLEGHGVSGKLLLAVAGGAYATWGYCKTV